MEQLPEIKRPHQIYRAKRPVWPFVFAAIFAHFALVGLIVALQSIKPLPDTQRETIEVELISFAPAPAEEVAPSLADDDPGPVVPPPPEPPPPEPPPPPPPIPEPPPPPLEPVEPPPPVQPEPEPEPAPEPVPEQISEPEPEPPPPPPPPPESAPAPPPAPRPPPPAPPPPARQGGGGSTADSVAAKASTAASFDAAYLNNPAPRYPISAFRERAEGTVIVRAEVMPDGKSGQVVLHRSSGFKSLDDAAVSTVKKWRFKPATDGGKPVKQWVNIPITFTLSKR